MLLSFFAVLIMIVPFGNVVFGAGGNEENHSVSGSAHAFGARDEQKQRENLLKSDDMLCDFEKKILELTKYGICSSAEGANEKMGKVDNRKEIKSIFCGSVKSLDDIFANFSNKFHKGGELHNFTLNKPYGEKERAKKHWVSLHTIFILRI
jgi:hypothetical protein